MKAKTGSLGFTTKGRVVIPAWPRKRFEVEEGAEAMVQATSEGILLQRVGAALIRRGRGIVQRRPGGEALAEDFLILPPINIPFHAVTLDVGGTLIEPYPSVGHVYAEVAMEHGLTTLSPELLNRRFSAAWKQKKEFSYARADWKELVLSTFAGLRDEEEVDALFEPLYQRFERPRAWRIFPDVPGALDALKRNGVRLAVISNWDERLRPLLEALGLRSFFEVIVVSAEFGFHKPAPEIFERARDALDVPAGEILHVGDHPTEDVEGALAAGLHALMIDRKALASGAGIVRSLGEILTGAAWLSPTYK